MTILEIIGKGVHRKALCECDCGNKKLFFISNIAPKQNARYTVSCGCKKNEIVASKNTKHGMIYTKFYKRWRSMFDRCSPKYICANAYKGINVCDRWSKFENFKEDMYDKYLEHKEKFGERQTTLDRINPYKNYCLKNCRWATFKEQAKTTKKNYDKKETTRNRRS